MAENVEDIEAKLAAYIDGELTPAERIEIETHLVNNPSHRSLLADLGLHRNLIRNLPREKAPGDCTEGFQSQLERDILLGGNELSGHRNRFRINYSPQLLSAAAIILLAVGLAIVVYSVLPPHHPKAPLAQLATEPAKPAEPGIDGTGFVPDRSFKAGGGPERLAKKGAVSTENLSVSDAIVQDNADENKFAAFKTLSDPAAPAMGDMMVITVTADDLNGANDAVVSYLALNKINYSAPDADFAWKDGAAAALSTGRRLSTASEVAGGAGGHSRAPTEISGGVAVAQRAEAAAKLEESLPRERNAAQPSVAQGEKPALDSLRGVEAEIQPAPTQAAARPTTQPSAIASGTAKGGLIENAKTALTTQDQLTGAASGTVLFNQQQRQYPVQQLADLERGGARVILAQNMNDKQVRELTRSLSQPDRNQWAIARRDVVDVNTTTLAARWNDDYLKQKSFALTAAGAEREVMLRQKMAYKAAPTAPPTTRPAEPTELIRASGAGITRAEADVSTRLGQQVQTPAITTNLASTDTLAAQGAPAQQDQPLLALHPTTQQLLETRVPTFTCMIVLQDNAKGKVPATQPANAKASIPPPAPTAPEPAK